MSAQRLFRNSLALRVLAVGGSLSWGRFALSFDDDDKKNPSGEIQSNPSFQYEENLIDSHRILQKIQSLSSLLEPTTTSLDAAFDDADAANTTVMTAKAPTKTIVYDFVILGHGNAGQSAVRTLRQRCPNAKIAVLDPLRSATSAQVKVDHYYRDTATRFNPQSRTVQLLSDPHTQLQYKHGILIATGARGAPPPLELFQESSLSRVLELRTTELLGNTKRPVMAPDRVRRAVIDAASRGGKIAILGSGWEALDLACAAEQVGRKTPTIVFGNPGPVWNILPQYLSSELRKKLVKRDIDIHDRSSVRYVADIHYAKTKKLELHTAKTYDIMETRRTVLDLLVIAPDSFGAKGTAALPTTEVPERMKESSDGRPWYKTWSQLTKSSPLEPSMVACFEDDGRVAVNTELCAVSRVFAAGSVAKYPNSSTGQASIAGEGTMDGAQAGRVAAMNMSREYLERRSSFGHRHEDDIQSFAASSLPVWRSDIASYPGQGSPVASSLSRFGVQAVCVGNCDSERLATRGFWWTNSSAQRKIARMLMLEDEEEQNGKGGGVFRMTRRRHSRQRRKLGLVTPIYGIGVVYYLDSNGRIRGIMTWGLPFAAEEGGPINPSLLGALKHAIVTNAGVSALDAEENHQTMNAALAKQSQRCVALAVRGQTSESTTTSHGLGGPIEGFSTPLYRYTEVGTAKNSNLNVLKRKEAGGLGVLGEDLYARDELAIEQEQVEDKIEETPLNNIPATTYPVTVVPFNVEEAYGSKAASLDSLLELNRYLAVQGGWEDNENRARPGKEDPLWLRPGDERRNVSKKQMMIDAYRSIMFPHRS